MKYVSEITGKTYNTENDCLEAEKAFKETQLKQKAEKEKLTAEIQIKKETLQATPGNQNLQVTVEQNVTYGLLGLITLFHSNTYNSAAAYIFRRKQVFIFNQDSTRRWKVSKLFQKPAANSIHFI